MAFAQAQKETASLMLTARMIAEWKVIAQMKEQNQDCFNPFCLLKRLETQVTMLWSGHCEKDASSPTAWNNHFPLLI